MTDLDRLIDFLAEHDFEIRTIRRQREAGYRE